MNGVPKCLSLTQPWATLVALNEKRVETRGWKTDYRGPLLIHAAKNFPSWAIKLCFTEPFHAALTRAGILDLNNLPLGCIVAASSLDGVMTTKEAATRLSATEIAFGDYSPGRYAFQLGIADPTIHVPCSGSLSLWEAPKEVLDALGIQEEPPPLLRMEAR